MQDAVEIAIDDKTKKFYYTCLIRCKKGGEVAEERLLIDTGGSHTFLSQQIVERLDIKANIKKQSYQTVFGTVEVRSIVVPEFTILGVKRDVQILNQPVLVFERETLIFDKDTEDLTPVLGLDVLSKGRALFDFGTGRMFLAPPLP